MQVGDSYTREQLIEKLQITKSLFNTHNKDVMDYLGSICEYEIKQDPKDGRKKNYYIKKILKPFAPYQNKRKRQKEKNQKYYIKIIKNYLPAKKQKYETASRIAREEYSDQKNIDISLETYTKNIRQQIKEQYGTYYKKAENEEKRVGYVKERHWCLLDKENNTYSLMSDEQKNYLRMSFQDAAIPGQKEIDDWGSYASGDISSEDYDRLLKESRQKKFKQVLYIFFNKYGCWPVMTNEYEDGKQIPQEVLDRYANFEKESSPLIVKRENFDF